MKSIKQNPISTKGPDRGKIVLHIIDNTWVYLIIFVSKKPDMKFITADSRYLEFDGTMEKFELAWYYDTGKIDVNNNKLSIHNKCHLGRHASMIMKSTQRKRFIYWIICRKLILIKEDV
jgi:hypothetical protein